MLTFSVNKRFETIYEENTVTITAPKSDSGRQWLSAGLIRIADGKLRDEKLNVDAYGRTADTNSLLGFQSKYVSILNDNEMENGNMGVSEAVASFLGDTMSKGYLDNDEVHTLVDEFLEVHEDLLIEEGINLWQLLTMSLSSKQVAVDNLKNIVSEYGVGDLVTDVLTNKVCLMQLSNIYG